jgi:hypothetical protein
MLHSPQFGSLGRKKRRIRYRLADEPTTGLAFGTLGCGALSPGASPPGTTLQFTDKGAQKLTNVHVVLIFWGKEWANSQLANLVTNAVQGLLAGPYMSYLAQYGVRRGSIWGTKFVTDGDPPNPFGYSDIGNFVINQLDVDNLPEPDSDWPIVYAVLLPSNVSFQGDPRVDPPGTVVSNVLGANSSIIWNDYDLGDVDNDPAYYFWVGNGGNTPIQANVDYITSVLSHELVEICTDPNGGDGIVQVGGASATSQIGDPGTSWCDNVRGVKAQSYWVHNLGDPLNGQCVLPKFYSVRRTLAGRNIGGRLGSLQYPIPSLNSLIASLF